MLEFSLLSKKVKSVALVDHSGLGYHYINVSNNSRVIEMTKKIALLLVAHAFWRRLGSMLFRQRGDRADKNDALQGQNRVLS